MNKKIKLKSIEGYEGLYSIMLDGRAWSHKRKGRLKGKWLKSFKDIAGYLTIGFRKNGKEIKHRIHRLVGETFIPNPQNKSDINHINGIKTDNRVENLEWCTSQENAVHARKIGLYDNLDNSGENNGRSKLNKIQVDEIRKNQLIEKEEINVG